MKEVAPENIHSIFVTLDTFQLLSGWLKEVALRNILLIFVTLDTFQLFSGWLKEFVSNGRAQAQNRETAAGTNAAAVESGSLSPFERAVKT